MLLSYMALRRRPYKLSLTFNVLAGSSESGDRKIDEVRKASERARFYLLTGLSMSLSSIKKA